MTDLLEALALAQVKLEEACAHRRRDEESLRLHWEALGAARYHLERAIELAAQRAA